MAAVMIASGAVCDVAGNCTAGIDAGPFKIDNVAPDIVITSPADGGTYRLNSAEASGYSCSDATSGIAMCAGPVPSGANFSTSPVGPHTFTVDAADVAGNPAQKTHTYTVVFELVAFASSRDGNFEIYSMNGDGSSPTRLTANPAADGVLQRSGCRCSCILTRGGARKSSRSGWYRGPGTQERR
jgi:hypothetical protein